MRRSKLFIKRPGKLRKSYALVGHDGKTIQDSRIDAVNRDLQRGMDVKTLEARMRLILDSYKPSARPEISRSNRQVVEDIHAYKCKRKPLNVDNENLKYPLLKAATLLKETSIYTASEDELLSCIKGLEPGPRYRAAKALNEMLGFLKRDFRIYNPKPPRPEEIAFIRIKDFLEKLPEIDNPDWRLYLAGLFATGCRLGELPLVRYDGAAAHISRQVDGLGRIRVTKNKVSRTAPILPPLQDQLVQLKHLGEDKLKQIRVDGYMGMYTAFKKVFNLRLHDLRHSYAVEWGAVGASTSDIARYIGDTEEVCRRHYRNYCATPDEILRAVERFKKP